MSKPAYKCTRKVVPDKKELAKELAKVIERSAAEAIKENGIFTLGLSGGSMAKFINEEVPSISTQWEAWRLLFVDERMVPVNSEHSTLSLYLEGLVSKTALTREKNFIEVDTALSASEAAKDYESKLRTLQCPLSADGFPVFDILLLGVGPDGHTASLFPGHPLVQESKAWVAPITDSPKPPPSRVTLTLPVINSARKCVFAMAGADKAQMVKDLLSQLEGPEDAATYPAALVRPRGGELCYFLEATAAAQL